MSDRIFWGDRVRMTLNGKEQLNPRHECDTRGICVGHDLDSTGRPIAVYVVRETRRQAKRYVPRFWEVDR